jgi:hypothetical protein
LLHSAVERVAAVVIVSDRFTICVVEPTFRIGLPARLNPVKISDSSGKNKPVTVRITIEQTGDTLPRAQSASAHSRVRVIIGRSRYARVSRTCIRLGVAGISDHSGISYRFNGPSAGIKTARNPVAVKRLHLTASGHHQHQSA